MGKIKTEEEIEKLKKASILADACFDFICHKIKIGMTEKEIATYMDEYMLSNGATELSFETIVGSGENSAQIHSIPTERKIEFGDIILLDFGCKVEGYCSDISRTIFVGEVKEEYKRIYEIVLAAHENGIKNIRAGMTAKEADDICRNIIQNKGYNFAHAVGHGVGTEVHEEPVISPKKDDILEDNMVITIEPGIYLEGRFGVRIEDTVLIKDGKVESLNYSSKAIVVLDA